MQAARANDFDGAPVAHVPGIMSAASFTSLIDRARADFDEMPGLELTLPQAARLWNMGTDECRTVVDTLVEIGFLRWTPRRTVISNGNISVRSALPPVISVAAK